MNIFEQKEGRLGDQDIAEYNHYADYDRAIRLREAIGASQFDRLLEQVERKRPYGPSKRFVTSDDLRSAAGLATPDVAEIIGEALLIRQCGGPWQMTIQEWIAAGMPRISREMLAQMGCHDEVIASWQPL